jgi:defect-in-organelle-trafficking protein DotA
MRKILLGFLLLILGSAAFADSAPDVLNPDAVTHYTDMSVFYLSQLFGTVGNVLNGSSSQMMGKLFYQLNWGIFLVSSVVIFYSVLMGALKLASEGITMAPGKSALYSLIKLAVGISLVIPNAGTGYCVMQDIVMQVVVKGVGMADSVWGSALDYLNAGGTVWSYPGSNDPTQRNNAILTQKSLDALLQKNKLAAAIFQNEVCMVGSRDAVTSSSVDNSGSIAVNTAARLYYDVQAKPDLMRFDFPGLHDDNVGTGASCGSISWNISDSCAQGSTSSDCAMTANAVSKLVYTLLPAAQQYYCQQHGNKDSCVGVNAFASNGVVSGLAPYLVASATGYFTAILPYAQVVQHANDESKVKFTAKAKQEGWLMAGRYYWDVMRVTRTDNTFQDLSTYTAPKDDGMVGPSSDLNTMGSLKDIVKGSQDQFAASYASKAFADSLTAVTTNSGTGSKRSNSGLIMNPGSATALSVPLAVFNPGLGATLATAIGMINTIGAMFNDWASYHYNPIEFLYKLGQACINVTMVIWIVGGVTISASVLLYSTCQMTSPLGAASRAVVDWVKPLLMLIATMFWMAGFFLCFYVPLYPFMVFLFASFGWFISVIEAMVAAPIVCLGLAHPESHDLLGKSEQAIMLLLSVFIQPTILVIGLIGGIILSYVSFEMLIYAFSAFVSDIMQTGSSASNTTTDMVRAVQSSALYNVAGWKAGSNLLLAPMLLIIFCTLTYTLLTQSFSLIYLLRDNVMKWIGAPTTGIPSVEQMLGDTRGAISQAGSRSGSAAADGVNAGMQSSPGAAKEAIDGFKEKSKQSKQSELDTPGSGQGPQDPPGGPAASSGSTSSAATSAATSVGPTVVSGGAIPPGAV